MKGGYNVPSSSSNSHFKPKALNDVSACTLGVELGDEITSRLKKKRQARVSADSSSSSWSTKCSRQQDLENDDHASHERNMELHFTLLVSLGDEPTQVVTDSD